MGKDDLQQKDQESAPQDATLEDSRAKALAEAERIKELRERLYARAGGSIRTERHELPKHEIHDTMEAQQERIERNVPIIPPQVEVIEDSAKTPQPAVPIGDPSAVPYGSAMVTPRRKSLRKKVALIGVLFFVLAMGVASFFLFVGNNTISGENISIDISGPISVGGGEELPFQVAVANQNTVPIQSATLIIEYPEGTQSVDDTNKEITTERKQLDTIGAGELLNIPLKVRMFGEENQEKEIKISVDYRVAGSNATFHKDATPLRFKVSTSPIVMNFDSVKTISSGQEIELKLTVQSNSPAPLTNILVKASYPEGFDFTESNPEAVSGEDTWRIATLKPSEKKIITVTGLMVGHESETRNFTATAGVANDSDQNALASMLARTTTDVKIEAPFLDVNVFTNGNSGETTIINTRQPALVEIKFTNALDSTIYDGKIMVELSGNALNEVEVKASDGFYNSSKNTITWDSTDVSTLKEILPGRTSDLSFSLVPREDIGQAPEIKMKITVRGQRVFEDQAPQELVGTAFRTIKVESVPTLTSVALHGTGPFTNTGPTPPVAEKVTQYTYSLRVETGTNDITGAEMTAVLPQYVSWLDLVTNGDDVIYNPNSRIMKWTIGDMKANSKKEVFIQVSVLPSLSQVDTTPTILEVQRFKATDRFTGTVVRVEHPALTTSLLDESTDRYTDGHVRKEE